MLKELNNYDWAEVFGEGGGGNCYPIKPNRAPMDTRTSLDTFSREDVVEITQMVEGEDGEASWIIYGRLRDGRWFFAEGGCDYTGWDCCASNSGSVALSKADIERFGMGVLDRKRFGIALT